MLLPLIADQIVRHLDETPRVNSGRLSPDPLPDRRMPVVPSPPAAEIGARYQLRRALMAMAQGQMMLVQRRMPAALTEAADEVAQIADLRALRDPACWLDPREMEPLLVPGTAYPGVVGPILLGAGCCAPCAAAHWVVNLRFFFLTERGHRLAGKAEAWWSELSLAERLRAMLLE